MPVSLIATDMDGTFLRDDKTYDEARFDALYTRFAARGGRFVAASGKQYHNLMGYFPRQAAEMAFIAENGSLVMQGGKKLYELPLPRCLVCELAALADKYGINLMMCGEKDSYVLPGQTNYRMSVSNYAVPPTEVQLKDVGNLEDTFFKFSLLMPEEEVDKNFKRLKDELRKEFAVMSSGFGYLDILHAEANKGAALEFLCSEWNIPYDERMAFGDAGNDAEMLQTVKYSYAMENGAQSVKKLCAQTAPPCNEDGVLQVMEQMLEEGW